VQVPDFADIPPEVHAALGGASAGTEIAVGVLLFLAPEPTTATKAAGIALILHGIDTGAAAILTGAKGEIVPTTTEQVVVGELPKLGVPEEFAFAMYLGIELLAGGAGPKDVSKARLLIHSGEDAAEAAARASRGGGGGKAVQAEKKGAAQASDAIKGAGPPHVGNDAIETAANGGVNIKGANFAQTDFRPKFSEKGRAELQKITGLPIKTVDDLAAAITAGKVDPSTIPVNVIVRDGNTLILNTRTTAALEQAGVPRSSFNVIDRTGDEFFEGLLTGQLERNKLTSAGIPTVRRQ